MPIRFTPQQRSLREASLKSAFLAMKRRVTRSVLIRSNLDGIPQAALDYIILLWTEGAVPSTIAQIVCQQGIIAINGIGLSTIDIYAILYMLMRDGKCEDRVLTRADYSSEDLTLEEFRKFISLWLIGVSSTMIHQSLLPPGSRSGRKRAGVDTLITSLYRRIRQIEELKSLQESPGDDQVTVFDNDKTLETINYGLPQARPNMNYYFGDISDIPYFSPPRNADGSAFSLPTLATIPTSEPLPVDTIKSLDDLFAIAPKIEIQADSPEELRDKVAAARNNLHAATLAATNYERTHEANLGYKPKESDVAAEALAEMVAAADKELRESAELLDAIENLATEEISTLTVAASGVGASHLDLPKGLAAGLAEGAKRTRQQREAELDRERQELVSKGVPVEPTHDTVITDEQKNSAIFGLFKKSK